MMRGTSSFLVQGRVMWYIQKSLNIHHKEGEKNEEEKEDECNFVRLSRFVQHFPCFLA